MALFQTISRRGKKGKVPVVKVKHSRYRMKEDRRES